MGTGSITANICAAIVYFVSTALAQTNSSANSTTSAVPTTADPNIKHTWWPALGFAIPISLLLVAVCVGRCICKQNRRRDDDKQKLTNQRQEFESDTKMKYRYPSGDMSTEDVSSKL